MATAACVNVDFSPGDHYLPLPQSHQSARLRRALAEMGSDAEFRDGVAPLETLGISVSHKRFHDSIPLPKTIHLGSPSTFDVIFKTHYFVKPMVKSIFLSEFSRSGHGLVGNVECV